MELSDFGKKFTSNSGILQLMDDLGNAMSGEKDICMLGGGNPAHIPLIQKQLRSEMEQILKEPGEFERMIGNYDTPQGEKRFIRLLAELLNREFGWRLTPENIAMTNGSQTAFFILFNILAGPCEGRSPKKILLPLTPEYIGYADAGVTGDFFISQRPEIEILDDSLFKYHVDFDRLKVTEDTAAICVSRPTNPTGNVLTDEEIEKLSSLARTNRIPLIIDNAYGLPFPQAIYTDVQFTRNPETVLCMSLSKFGLPSSRTGIIVASEEIIKAVSGVNAVLSLAPTNFGARIAQRLVSSGEITRMSRDIIRPFYRRKAEQAVAYLREKIPFEDFYIHKPEGAFFLWLWFRNFPVSSQELYERLKKRGVLVVPGQYFFPGLKEDWKHKHECIRITYSQADSDVKKGIDIIAEEVTAIYKG